MSASWLRAALLLARRIEEAGGHDGLGVVEKRRDEAGNQLGLRHDADVRRARQDRSVYEGSDGPSKKKRGPNALFA